MKSASFSTKGYSPTVLFWGSMQIMCHGRCTYNHVLVIVSVLSGKLAIYAVDDGKTSFSRLCLCQCNITNFREHSSLELHGSNEHTVQVEAISVLLFLKIIILNR